MIRIFLLILCFSTFVYAQEESALEKESKRLETLCKKNGNNPDSLSYYGLKLLKLGKDNNHFKGIVEGYFAIGYAASMTKDQDAFITYLDSALLYKDEIIENHFSDVARIMRNKAIAFTRKGEKDKAEQIFKEVIAECLKRDKIADAAYNYNSLGILEKERGNFDTALVYYNKSLEIWDELNNERPKASVFLNIGVAQASLANFSQAISSYHHGLSLAKKHTIIKDEYRFYNNLATAYISTQKNDSANFYLQKLIPYYSKTKKKYDLNLAYMNLGQVKLNQNKNKEAFDYLIKSIKGLKSSQNIKSICQNYRLIANSLLKLDDYDAALTYLDSASKLSKKHDLRTNFHKEHDLYAKIYEAKGDFQKANENLKFKDSINQNYYLTETANAYNQILVEQKVKNKDNAITELKDEKEFYKSNLFISLLLVLLLLILAFYLYKRFKNQKREVGQIQEKLNSYNKNSVAEEVNKELPLQLKSKAVLRIKSILYIKSDGHYLEIFCENKEKPEIERSSLITFLERLPKQDFIRIHKSFIVNIHKIKIINSTQVMLENGEWIKLSRTYKQELKDMLNQN